MADMSAPKAKTRCDEALDDLFKFVVSVGGVITGEHGIGIAKKPWWPSATSKEVRNLHRAIKNALDPNAILNPGKFL
jgi:glycolate oxidase